MEDFFNDHLTATTAQYPRDWQTQLVTELKHKLDTEWKDLSVSWNWQEITWDQLKTKITDDLKLRFPPLTQRDHWFNLSKQNNETIPQFIRGVHANISMSYLNQGLTKNQLVIQKTLSSISDHKIREEVLQRFKTLEVSIMRNISTILRSSYQQETQVQVISTCRRGTSTLQRNRLQNHHHQ